MNSHKDLITTVLLRNRNMWSVHFIQTISAIRIFTLFQLASFLFAFFSDPTYLRDVQKIQFSELYIYLYSLYI